MQQEENPLNPIQTIAAEFIQKQQPLDWFEEVYQKGKSGELTIAWADLVPNPNVKTWFEKYKIRGEGKTALVIGCGLGEDAEYLAELGYETDAFDISPTAIEWAKERWQGTKVNYFVADLFKLAAKQYDFVLEIYTIQTLPEVLRAKAIDILPNFIAENGQMLLICRSREENELVENVPYPLTKLELSALESQLQVAEFEEYCEADINRFRVLYFKSDLM